MKNISLLFASGLLAATFAVPVFCAEGYGGSAMGMGKTQKTAKAPEQCLPMHKIYGSIKEIDQEKGTLTVANTNGEEVKLHFPPADIKDLRNGNTITVELAFYRGAVEQ